MIVIAPLDFMHLLTIDIAENVKHVDYKGGSKYVLWCILINFMTCQTH